MSNALDELQEGFQDYILGRSDRALNRIESTATLSAERRLDIYHHAYRARLVEVLADTYERVALYIGEESFESAAQAYVENNTSSTRNLRDYGRTFPAFLKKIYPDDGEIAELADMDGRLRYSFDGLDANTLQASDIASIEPQDWDRVIFQLHPTTSFVTFNWNVVDIWRHLSDEEAPPSAQRLALAQTWLFWRKGLQPHYRSLAPEEHSALRSISEGRAFGEICGELAEQFPDSDVTVCIAGWLREWLSDGVLQELK